MFIILLLSFLSIINAYSAPDRSCEFVVKNPQILSECINFDVTILFTAFSGNLGLVCDQLTRQLSCIKERYRNCLIGYGTINGIIQDIRFMFDNCCDIRHLERCPLNRKFKACFPGRSIVETDRGNIQINKLKIGNKIKVIDRHGQIMFTPIIGWLHRNQNSMGFFQEIEAIRMTNETINFRISPKHLIAFWNKKSRRIKIKPAKNLCLDDELILAKDTEERVRIGKITQSMDHGLFAPLTDAGLMNINGVIVSCYSDVKSHNLAHKILAPLRHSKLLANKLNKKGINSFAYFLDKVFNSLN